MNSDEETKSRLRIFYLVFQLLLMMHMIASLWYTICKDDGLWIPPSKWVYAGMYPKVYDIYNDEDYYKYLLFLYNAMLFLGGNEMGPRTNI
jgi:hypothetical protein